MSTADYVAKDLSAEVAHATSLVPEDPHDESTYRKARVAALEVSGAAEAFARGDSDAGLQAIERTIRTFRLITRDFNLELTEVLPTETCHDCGILTTDFRGSPSVASPDSFLCATCVRRAEPGAAHEVLQVAQDSLGEQDPREGFARIAAFWSILVGKTIEPHDVATMLACLKVARLGEAPKSTAGYVEGAAYLAIASELSREVA